MADEAGTSQRGANDLQTAFGVWFRWLCAGDVNPAGLRKLESVLREAFFAGAVSAQFQLNAWGQSQPPDIGADVPGGGAV
jgi:hypothetical protein